MPDDPRVKQLLDQLLESHATPEEVCSSCVELLPVVRRRWRQMCNARDELDALFPPMVDPGMSLPVSEPEEMPLPSIPGYLIESVLGRGGMGVVFRAKHLRLNRVVALKMGLAGAYAGLRERERFQREAEAVASLRHPNVVQIHDVGDVDGRPYFTMELVEGGSLTQRLSGTPLPALEAAAILATLAQAVDAAHRAGIVHRDLKPANVLLTADGAPKISDFGLARRQDGEAGLTRTGTAVGTPSYMAPEQARGKGSSIEPTVDIYALGAILYETLTGRPPFRAETAAETVHQLLTQDPVHPSHLNGKVPRDLETICLKCLSKEPRLRYPGAAALADDLDRFLHGESISARPETSLARWMRRIRRRPGLSAAIAACMLMLIALVGGGAWTLFKRRAAEAETAATARAADEDLKEMGGYLRKSKWPAAKSALERAKGRLGDRAAPDLKSRLDQGTRDLELGIRLDAICLNGAETLDGKFRFERSDKEYEDAFREAGFGGVYDAPEIVAERIAASDIQSALVDALDHWAVRTGERDPHRQSWLLLVARETVKREPESNQSAWRSRARDPEIWKNSSAFEKLLQETQFAEQSVPLLLALAQSLRDSNKNPVPFMKRIQMAHPEDYWANYCLGHYLLARGENEESIRYLQTTVALRPEAEAAHSMLGNALLGLERVNEAIEQFRSAFRLDPSPRNHRQLAIALTLQGPFDEAVQHGRLALSHFPDDAHLHANFGTALLGIGQHDDEALQHFEKALAINPDETTAHMGLRLLYLRKGRAEEAFKAWGKALNSKFPPSGHQHWYGYAELCLFRGMETEYRRARQALLKNFGTATDPYIAERTSRACLLLPATGDELVRAAILAGRAVAADPTKYPPGALPYFLFVHGLAEYRQGRFEPAIDVLKGAASRMAGPSPSLVLAMAQHRAGRAAEARQTLAVTISTHDWRMVKVRDQDGWIAHILRQEAERLIVPEVSAFLSGKHEPRDDIERLAFIGACQAANRTRALARLYTELFAADPNLAQDYRFGHRAKAACPAAQAGCGRGEDTRELGEPERARLRAQANDWLRADLAAWNKALDNDAAATRDLLKRRIATWQSDPDLACVREAAELAKLPRQEWLALWKDVGTLLTRATATK